MLFVSETRRKLTAFLQSLTDSAGRPLCTLFFLMNFCTTCQKKLRRHGSYWVAHKRTRILRFYCPNCKKSFSSQSHSPCKWQKKSHLNKPISQLLCHGLSMRGIARCLSISYTTVYRKFLWLADNLAQGAHKRTQASHLYLDEMQSIEHTKLKPLSIALAVTNEYQILAAVVGTLPAKGHLAQVSKQKYGKRKNESSRVFKQALQASLAQIKSSSQLEIRTDKNPIYPRLISHVFTQSRHRSFPRKIDESPFLKYNKNSWDPLFPLNQRCAKLRSDIKRLVRRSWCTTKKKENLQKHLNIYIAYNNLSLPKAL